MRADTEVVLGIRSVGDKGHEPIIESMTMIEAMKRVAQFVADSSMSQRFQFTFARSREDALIGLGLSATAKDARRRERALEITGFIDNLFDSSDALAGGQKAEQNSNEDSQS